MLRKVLFISLFLLSPHLYNSKQTKGQVLEEFNTDVNMLKI